MPAHRLPPRERTGPPGERGSGGHGGRVYTSGRFRAGASPTIAPGLALGDRSTVRGHKLGNSEALRWENPSQAEEPGGWLLSRRDRPSTRGDLCPEGGYRT